MSGPTRDLDRDLVLALETRLVNAWPSFEVELVDGWLLRFAEGYSKRANSATAIMPGARLDRAAIAAIRSSFAARGIAPCVRLTGIEAPDAEAALAAAGLVDYDPSLGMVAPLDAVAPLSPQVRIAAAASPGWITAAAAAYGGDKANGEILGRIVGRIQQAAGFATVIREGHEAAAWGLAVAERGFVGLYDIVVAPEHRGHGIGRTLVTSLMAWGRQQGASRAYLQMRETNTVASGLYRSLGFETAYRYTHRVPAGTPGR